MTRAIIVKSCNGCPYCIGGNNCLKLRDQYGWSEMILIQDKEAINHNCPLPYLGVNNE